MDIRVSTLAFQVLGYGRPGYSATTTALEALTAETYEVRVSFARFEALTREVYETRAGRLSAEVLCRFIEPIAYVPAPNILPWPVPPDWRSGVTERLKWKTDILISQNGTEQRRKLRTSPRRTIEADYRTYARDRRLLDALLTGPGSTLWQVPLWWEKYPLTQPGLINDSVLYLDHRWSEFQPGNVVMVYGGDPFTYEMLTIANLSSDGTRLTMSNLLTRSWPAGTPVYNTRKCRLDSKSNGARKADNAFDIKLTFETVEPNDYPAYLPPNAVPGPALQLEFKPNFLNDLSVEYSRMYAEFDNQTGKNLRLDSSGRAFHVHQFEYMAVGRQASDRFRGFLYWLQGKLLEIYVPSYFQDIELLSYASALAAQDGIFVIAAGYSTYLGSDVPDRNALLIYYKDGTVSLRFVVAANTVGPDPYGNHVEYVRFSAPLGRDTNAYNVDKISYMMVMRQDVDELQITHESDSSGVTNYATTFRSVGPPRHSQPYDVAFNGTYAKNANPPQLTIDIQRYLPPPVDPTKPTEPDVSVNTPEQGSGGNADGSGGAGGGGGED